MIRGRANSQSKRSKLVIVEQTVPLGTNTSTARSGSSGQFDSAGVMSQILQSPALDGLLSGVLEQTGVGSPGVLRSMLQ